MSTPPPLVAPSGAGRRIHLFGPMRVVQGGSEAVVRGSDSQRLLGYLALHPRVAHRREVLIETLWPDAPERSRRALSDTLYRVRRQLGDGWIEADADTVALATNVTADVWDFDRAAASRDTDDLEMAADMHTGDLVPGLYDDWALEHRELRRAALVAALDRLADRREQAGDLQHAVLDARRLLVVDPLNEIAHQRYLRLLGRLHRYGEAIEHYESLRKLFAEQVGVAPLSSTTEIVERLRVERDVVTAAPIDDRSRWVGRVAERSSALAAVEALFDGRGGVLGVEGRAGLGKTRLLSEIVGSARWRGAAVASGDVREVPEASPLAPLARALGPLLTAPLVVQIESSLDAASLPTLGPLHEHWRSASRTPGAARDDADRLRQALRVVGETLGGAHRTVIALDDLHWAGPSLWDALTAFADGFVSAGGLLVAAYRRTEIEKTAGWSLLQAWDRQGHLTVVPLSPLDRNEVAELLGVDADDADDVYAFTGGVPFYLTQWLDSSAGDRGDDGATMIARRFDALPAPHRAALESAAVIGEHVPFRAWIDVLESPPLELAAICDHLIAARWIVGTTTGHEFTHDLLRAAVYRSIPEPQRRTMHERAARAVTRLDPDNARTRAYHLDRAGLAQPAADAYRQAGTALRDALAFGDAIEVWGRALELLPADRCGARLELGLDFADVCDVVGGSAAQREILAETTASARRLGDDPALLRSLLLSGGSAARTGDVDEAEEALAEAEQIARRLGDRRRLADAMYRRGDLLIQSGQLQRGQEQFRAGLELVGRDEDSWLHGRLLRGLAISAMRMGRTSEAVQWLDEAVAGYRASGDSMNELVASSNLLSTYYELGSWDQIRQTAEHVLALARRLGDPVTLGVAYQNLALAALAVGERTRARDFVADAERAWAVAQRHRLIGLAVNTRGLIAEDDGDDAEALACYRAALDTARAIDAGAEVAYASHDLGALLHKLGRPTDAIALLRASADYWAETGNVALRARSDAYLALALLDVGERDEASSLADSVLGVLRAGPVEGEHPEVWLWALSQLLDRLDRPADAGEALSAAHGELARQAATIADAEQRRGLFERVPLNRAIMAAVEARSGSTGATGIVRLAHVAAPLGRTLRPDELVEVRWTLHAPDDDEISDTSERRRHRLRRLLDEAARCDAAPTDDDLATALGVSRRTILRDMATFGDSTRSTRRRVRQLG